MKRIFLFITVISLFALSVETRAQDMDLREKLGFGLKAGINIANIYDTEGDDFEHDGKVGLAAGAFLSVPIGKYIGFQPEILYSQKGYKGKGTVVLVSYEYTRKTDYIDIPLQLQIKPAPAVTLLFGPQYSFLVRKGFEVDSNVGDIGDEDEEDVDIRKYILGVTTGLDLNFNRFVLSGRVAWDLQRNEGDDESSIRYRNVIYQITAGVFF